MKIYGKSFEKVAEVGIHFDESFVGVVNLGSTAFHSTIRTGQCPALHPLIILSSVKFIAFFSCAVLGLHSTPLLDLRNMMYDTPAIPAIPIIGSHSLRSSAVRTTCPPEIAGDRREHPQDRRREIFTIISGGLLYTVSDFTDQPQPFAMVPAAFVVPFALLVAFLWGVQPLIHKVVLKTVGFKTVMFVGGLVYFVCLVVFAAFCWTDISSDLSNKLDAKSFALIALASFMSAFVANLLYLYVLKDHKSYVVSALIYVSPVFTLALAASVLREKVTAVGAVGVLLIVVGVILVSFKELGGDTFLLKED